MTARPALANQLEDLIGLSAVPRVNGELVFEEPWQARAFGIVVALYEAGHFSWDDFRSRLIVRIAAAGNDDGAAYYQHWLAAFEDLMSARALLTAEVIDARAEVIAAADSHNGSGEGI